VTDLVPDAWAGAFAQLEAVSDRVDGLGAELARQRFDREAEVGVLASLSFSMGRLADGLDLMREEMAAERLERRSYLPIDADFQATGIPVTPPGGGPVNDPTLVLDCGGPAQGRCWSVRRIVVGGTQLATTAAGTAEVYAYAGPPDAGLPILAELQDATILASTPLPNIAYYNPGQVVVQPPEHLWVIFRNATASQQYCVGGTATDYRVDGYDAGFLL
jgi:hypothetical protein